MAKGAQCLRQSFTWSTIARSLVRDHARLGRTQSPGVTDRTGRMPFATNFATAARTSLPYRPSGMRQQGPSRPSNLCRRWLLPGRQRRRVHALPSRIPSGKAQHRRRIASRYTGAALNRVGEAAFPLPPYRPARRRRSGVNRSRPKPRLCPCSTTSPGRAPPSQAPATISKSSSVTRMSSRRHGCAVRNDASSSPDRKSSAMGDTAKRSTPVGRH
jgi:hypothetical protein